jgi:hypothetical protein
VVLWNEEERERAFACFLRAFLADPLDPDARDNLFRTCRELGREEIGSLLREMNEGRWIQTEKEDAGR